MITLRLLLIFIVLLAIAMGLVYGSGFTGKAVENIEAKPLDEVFASKLGKLDISLSPGENFVDEATSLKIEIEEDALDRGLGFVTISEVRPNFALANSLVEWEVDLETHSISKPIKITFPEDSREQKILNINQFTGDLVVDGDISSNFFNFLGIKKNVIEINNPRGDYIVFFKTDPIGYSESYKENGNKVVKISNSGDFDIPNLLVVSKLEGMVYQNVKVLSDKGDFIQPTFFSSNEDGVIDSFVFSVSIPSLGKGEFVISEFNKAEVDGIDSDIEIESKEAVNLNPLEDAFVGIPKGCSKDSFKCTLFSECRATLEALSLKEGEINAYFKERTCFSDGSFDECPVTFFRDKQICSPGEKIDLKVEAIKLDIDLEPGEELKKVELLTKDNEKVAEVSISKSELNIIFSQDNGY